MFSSVSLLRRLRNNLRLQKDELERIQLKKLQLLIRHAYDNVSYYRSIFDSAGLKPQDIRSASDIRYIPYTDKSTFRKLPLLEKTASNIDINKCLEVFTSGSTGEPTHIYYTHDDNKIIELVYLRSFLENGLRFRDKRAFILDPHSFETKKCWYHSIGLARYENVSCFDPAEEQLQMLRTIRPDFIHGYPSSLALMGSVILEKGISDLKPRMVSTAAELLHKKEREIINAAFGVNLYDRYAARECGNIAWECDRHNGYHVNTDTMVVETVRDSKPAEPGERGEVIVTNLHSYAMPFIRYRIGDIGIMSDQECACGVETPMMFAIEGRDEDFITLNDGRKISPMMITGTLDHVPGIRQFRVIQESMEEIIVLLAKGEGFMTETLQRAETGLRRILDAGINIKCHVLDDIPRESNGKVRAVISKVSKKGNVG
jgi:phenylacetate-CoA ligase